MFKPDNQSALTAQQITKANKQVTVQAVDFNKGQSKHINNQVNSKRIEIVNK